MKKLFEYLRQQEEYLDEAGFVSNKAALDRLQEAFYGCRLLPNAWWEFKHFCIYSQTLPEPLHLADLGIFPALLEAIFEDFDYKVIRYVLTCVPHTVLYVMSGTDIGYGGVVCDIMYHTML
jgi:hypothetical protein